MLQGPKTEVKQLSLSSTVFKLLVYIQDSLLLLEHPNDNSQVETCLQ